MGLDPDFRGRGLGRSIVDAFLAQGQAEGFRDYQLNVFAENHPAVRLYRAAGFQVYSEFSVGAGQFRYYCMMVSR